jgi:hypothetical protein
MRAKLGPKFLAFSFSPPKFLKMKSKTHMGRARSQIYVSFTNGGTILAYNGVYTGQIGGCVAY